MSWKVELNGKIVLADQPLTWRRVEGTRPSTMSVRLPKPDADELLQASGRNAPLTLTITYPDGRVESITPLYVIAAAPTETPHIGCLVLADRRWWWSYQPVLRRYNMRRRSNYERVTTVDAQGNYATEPVAPKFTFRQFSLKTDGEPYSVRDMLSDLIATIDPDAQVEYDPSVSAVPMPAVDDVEVRGTGDTVLDTVLQYMPELAVTVEIDGKVTFYSRAAGLDVDQQTVAAVGPTVDGQPHVFVQDLRPVCPAYYDIYFDIEAEVRFDSTEPNGQSTVVDPFEVERSMVNVLAVPDYEIEVRGNKEVQGSWVDYEDYLDAVAADPPQGLGNVAIDLELVRTAAIPGVGLWEALGQWGELDPDDDWQGRIAALSGYLRTFYRLPRGWIDSILGVSATRVATVSQATGTRGRALAYADHALVASTKTQVRDASEAGGPGVRFATNVLGYTDVISPSTRPAPAVVSIADEDLGIVQIAYQTDPWGQSVVVLPGLVEADGVPVQERSDGSSQALAFNALTANATSLPRLAEQHRIAVILTLRPGSPNNIGQLYRVRVRPQDVVDVLHPRAAEVALAARGPALGVMVRQETARLRWSDPDRALIEQLFLGPELTDEQRVEIGKLVVNDSRRSGPLGATRGGSLDTIARSIAARGWASYALHMAGSTTGGAGTFSSPPLRGYAQSVETQLRQTGELLTSVQFAERLPEFDWTSLLDAGTRAILFRQIPR